MCGDLALDFGDADQRLVPARLELAGNESVDGISSVILPEGTVGGIARRFEITAESLSHLIPSLTGLFGRSHRSGDSTGSDNTENCRFNRVVDAQASKCDAAWFSSVQPAAPAAVTWDMMLRAGIAERQLASAAATANQSGEQGLTMLGRTVMPARRDIIIRDHRADRFEPLPADIAFVSARLEAKPVGARLTATLHAWALFHISHRRGRFTIRICAAVHWVLDHPVESGVARSPPNRVAIALLRRKFEALLVEPEQCLSSASEFLDLVEDQRDCRLHASIRILLIAIANLHEADRRRYDEFTATGFLMAC